MKTSVLIIGAGITGTSISRELSKYDAAVTLIEKESDIAFGGATKANTAIIHAGYDDEPSTLAAKLCPRGSFLWSRLATELNIPLRRIGSLVVALKDEEIHMLDELMERGRMNGVPELEIIEGKELLRLEPNLNKEATAGLYAPTAGIISPYEAAIALAENSGQNGVQILFRTEATGFIIKNGEVKAVRTNRGTIHARYVVNAAGLYADEISAKAGIEDFKITPRKGEYIIYDKDLGELINHVLFPIPSLISKGIVVTPTVDRNIIAGPNAQDVRNKDCLYTTSFGLQEVLEGAHRLVPKLYRMGGYIISSFAGLRPHLSTADFMIKCYMKPRGFVNVAGIESPGLTSAPAIAETVVDILREEGLKLKAKKDFKPFREPILHPIRDFNPTETRELMRLDSRYGHVVCRCEHVTEGEIIEAIRRGATTLDGVKYRTRTGMGRCQGGFCTPHVIKVLASELGLPVEEITKRGGNSKILPYAAKRLLVGDKDD